MTTSPGFSPAPWMGTSSPGWSAFDVSCLTVTLGPIVFATSSSAEPLGPVVWGLHEVSGWDDTVPTATAVQDHPVGHGSRAGLHRLESRPVTLGGLMRGMSAYGAGSPSGAMDALRRLRRATLTVAERGGLSRELSVRIVQGQVTRVRGAGRLAHFTISLIADDPCRYLTGHLDIGVGSTRLENRGDMQAWPLIEASGPVTITIAGPWGTTTAAIPAGAHTIDAREGVVWGPSGTRVDDVVSGPWPYVRAGGDTWTVGGMSAAGRIRVRHTEAWS